MRHAAHLIEVGQVLQRAVKVRLVRPLVGGVEDALRHAAALGRHLPKYKSLDALQLKVWGLKLGRGRFSGTPLHFGWPVDPQA